MKEELAGLLIVDTPRGLVEGEDLSSKRFPSIPFNICLKFVRTSIVVLPVAFRSNSSPSGSTISISRLSFLPEIFSSDVRTVGGATGNLVNKTIVVPNKAPVKRGAHILPGI